MGSWRSTTATTGRSPWCPCSDIRWSDPERCVAAPANALQVGQPGDGSEARANAWNVLSSREYRRGIEKVEPEQYADVLAKIEATDVVHYRHKDDDHTHLGVIAEDSPREILAPDGQAVSLGNYSAFLLAGMKAQQKQIDELRAELREALR